MAKLGSASPERDSEQRDPEGVEPGAVERASFEDDADDAYESPQYADLLNTDWIERAGDADAADEDHAFEFDVELSGGRPSDVDDEVVNLFELEIERDVGPLLTSSPLVASDFEAGPLDPAIAEGLIDARAGADDELTDPTADELHGDDGLRGLSLPTPSDSALERSDEEVGDDERFPVFDEAPGAAPLDWADDAGQEGIAEDGD